ncbi:hypothetical protein DERF_003376 [Dermatophagoides farinae]|uniref:Uncharacterized protein n=1 Tax=Dermatophagoides farinae TaxID=6954 RepID=A0A922LDJ5_DERFA|nr:hypothetical protein DERF_003376 [Dermatophagoides farinae]
MESPKYYNDNYYFPVLEFWIDLYLKPINTTRGSLAKCSINIEGTSAKSVEHLVPISLPFGRSHPP